MEANIVTNSGFLGDFIKTFLMRPTKDGRDGASNNRMDAVIASRASIQFASGMATLDLWLPKDCMASMMDWTGSAIVDEVPASLDNVYSGYKLKVK